MCSNIHFQFYMQSFLGLKTSNYYKSKRLLNVSLDILLYIKSFKLIITDLNEFRPMNSSTEPGEH